LTLKDDIQAAIKAADMEAGVSVLHIESGEQIDVNGDESYPMASVFKIPVLATAGQQLKAGKLKLDDRIPLKSEDKSAGSGILQFLEAGVSPTFRDLLTLMIIISDNTATDMNVATLGGPLVIEGFMHQLGLNDIYLKMDCKNLLKGLFPPEIQDQPLEVIHEWSNHHDIVRDGVTFSRGSDNDVSTAKAMTKLVYMLFKGEVVDGEIKDELLKILRQSEKQGVASETSVPARKPARPSAPKVVIFQARAAMGLRTVYAWKGFVLPLGSKDNRQCRVFLGSHVL